MSVSRNLVQIFKTLCTTLIIFSVTMNTARSNRFARSESRIVDGVNVTPVNKYPMMVSIGLQGNPKFAGTILNKYYVLTSAECAEFVEENLERVHVEAGVYYVGDPDSRYLQTIAVRTTVKHVRFNDASKGRFANDIGVLRLRHPLVWNDHVAPTNLPAPDWNVLKNIKTNVIAVGWGIGRNGTYPYPPTRPLQEIEVPLLTTEICQHNESLISVAFTDDQLCTDPGDFSGVCIDDFGGPLFLYNEVEDKHVQIGIISIANADCGNSSSSRTNLNAVYTKVSKFFHWIEEAIRECNHPRDF